MANVQIANCTAGVLNAAAFSGNMQAWFVINTETKSTAVWGLTFPANQGACTASCQVDMNTLPAFTISVTSSDDPLQYRLTAIKPAGAPTGGANYVLVYNPSGMITGNTAGQLVWASWGSTASPSCTFGIIEGDNQICGVGLVDLDILFPGNPALATQMATLINSAALTAKTAAELYEALMAAVALRGATWMTQTWSVIGPRTLGGICVPGAHDAGASAATLSSGFSHACNTQTQALDIGGQLAAGVRFFDMRPSFSTKLNGYYLTHFTVKAKQWWGAFGQELQSALTQISTFLAQDSGKDEVVILKFSHFAELGDYFPGPLSQQQFTAIAQMVQQTLDSYLFTSSDTSINLNQMTMNDIVASASQRRPCVIALFDVGISKQTKGYTFPKNLVSPVEGVFAYGDTAPSDVTYPVTPNYYMYDLYSNSNQFHQMVLAQQKRFRKFTPGTTNAAFLLSFTMTCQDIPCTGGQVGAARSLTCISQMARYCNPLLVPTVFNWIRQKYVKQGHMPNVLYLDYVGQYSDNAVVLAAELNARYGG
jgi:hypothetical protein